MPEKAFLDCGGIYCDEDIIHNLKGRGGKDHIVP